MVQNITVEERKELTNLKQNQSIHMTKPTNEVLLLFQTDQIVN